jgi:sugar transferase (PEP-CTERM/EpsH1 system associated)
VKILFVCHRFPFPPKRGGKIRPFNIIKHLSQNHEIVVASLARSKEEIHLGAGLKNYCSRYIVEVIPQPLALTNILIRLPSDIPFSMGYFFSSKLKKRVQQEVNSSKFDLIFVHCSSVAQYVENVNHIPKILDFGDMDSEKWTAYGKKRSFPINIIFNLEGTRLRRAEEKLATRFGYCTCTTLKEMETLQNFNLNVNTAWFPNGVDADYFKPTYESYEPDTLCFLGRMDYYPNQECMFDFCAHTLPLIQQKRPGTKLYIVGADPSRAILQLGKKTGVIVTGSVLDVRKYVQKCAVNIAPLNIARGTQNKILESLAMGVPVVSSICAAGGVDAVPGEHFLTAGNHKEFAAQVIRLLSDKKERSRFAEAGRTRMLSHHNWETSMKKLDNIIEDRVKLKGNYF